MSGVLNILTIYDRPRDHPNHVVLSSFAVGEGGQVDHLGSALCDTIQEARAIPIGRGMFCLGRSPDDHPTVVESWV